MTKTELIIMVNALVIPGVNPVENISKNTAATKGDLQAVLDAKDPADQKNLFLAILNTDELPKAEPSAAEKGNERDVFEYKFKTFDANNLSDDDLAFLKEKGNPKSLGRFAAKIWDKEEIK